MVRILNFYKHVLFALSIVILAASAEPVEEWNRTYGDTGENYLTYLQQTMDGGYMISGRTCLNTTISCEGLLIKTGAEGNLEWKRTYGGSITYVRQTMDGGYIIIGSYSYYPDGNFFLIKTDENGSLLWNRTYNEPLRSVLQTEDGGYIAAGSIVDPASGHLDAQLLRTDASGGELWAKKYGGVGNEYVTSFQRTPDGGYLLKIWGASELFKTDANGNEFWNKKIKPVAGYPTNILQTGDGGYVMIGSIGDEYWLDAWLARTDANFTIQFARQFRLRQPWNSARSVIETSDGGYLMVVDTGFRETRVEDYEIWLVRTDNNGSMLWSRRFGGISSDNCAVQQIQDGGYIFGCTRYSAGVKDIWITKLESDLNMWSMSWLVPVYSAEELRNSTEIPEKYLDDISEEDIKAVLDAASRQIWTFDGSRYESIRASLSLEGKTLRDNIWVKLFIFELDGYRGGRKESWQIDIERPEKEKNTSVNRVLGGGTLVPENYVGIAKSIAFRKLGSELLETPELTEASWIINDPGIVVLKFKDPESPAHAIVTVDVRYPSVRSVEKKYWFQPSFPIYFNITSNPDGADVYLAKGGLGDLCGGQPYKPGGDLIGKTPLTYKYEYNQTFIPFSGLFSQFSFNLTGYEDAFKCININGGESAGGLSVSIYPYGSLEPVSEVPLSYNISAGLKPEKNVPGFEFVFLIGVFLLIYLLGSKKAS